MLSKGPWVAQSLNGPTLDFGLGHDPVVCEIKIKPLVRLCTDSAEPTWDCLSPLCPSTAHTRVCSLSQNK